MQFKLFAFSAFAASVSAQASSSGLNQASVYAVLATALPSSLVAEALTNPGAVTSKIESEFSAGSTPTWFTALPTPIQTYLLGQGGASNSTTLLPGNSSSIIANNSSSQSKTATVTRGRTTHLTGVAHTTRTNGATTGGAASSTSGGSSGASSSSSGGASMPTQIIGAGIAGVVGLVGLFAL